jgi:hypothetical protein
MTGVHERKAIKDWVSAKGADEDILEILPTLDRRRARLQPAVAPPGGCRP